MRVVLSNRHNNYLFIAAAVLYNAWLAGYFLNKPVIVNALASDLAARGQPYAWFFITGDVIVGGLVLLATALALKSWSIKLLPRHLKRLAAGLYIFGFFTALSALLPINCTNLTRAHCLIVTDKAWSLHNITGALAALGLFLSIVEIFLILDRYKTYVTAHILARTLLVFWPLDGIIYLWLVFGNQDARMDQQLFNSLTSLSLLVIGSSLIKLRAVEEPTSGLVVLAGRRSRNLKRALT